MTHVLRSSRVFRIVPAFGTALLLGAAWLQEAAERDPSRVAVGGGSAAGQGGSAANGGQPALPAGAGGAAVEPEDRTRARRKSPGPKMVRITVPWLYRVGIDQHEVTQSQYHAYALEIRC